VEKVVILGVDKKPASVKAGGVDLQWHYEEGVGARGKKEGSAGKLIIKNPGVSVVESWEIEVV
jgi:alpha 1,3-glucosidase